MVLVAVGPSGDIHMLVFMNILYPILALIAMIMLAHKIKAAFIIFLFVEILMVYIGVTSGQYGIAVMAVMYFFTNIYAYRKWSK
jgi:nicotinamide riboside transporter PnuC